MDSNFIEKQINSVNSKIEETVGSRDFELEKHLKIIHDYLLSLQHPEKFSELQIEDLRKLAQELSYKEDTEFDKWWEHYKRA